MEPKEYHIKSFKQICNAITDENLDNLIIDMAIGLSTYLDAVKKMKAEFPKLKNKSNWDILRFEFNWVDDGKNDVVGIKVTNDQTGETKYYPNESVKQ